MRCPHCRDRLIQKSSDGELRMRVRGAIRVDSDGLVKAQCHWCQAEVELPLMVKADAPAIPEQVRFVLKPSTS